MVKYDYTYALSASAGSSATATHQYGILHETGNANNVGTNSAKNEAAYMHNNWSAAYTHAIAGYDRVYIIGEPGYVAYGAGSPANERSPFQIELSRYSSRTKAIQAYKNWITAMVTYCKKYSIPLTLDGAGNGVKSHKWVSDNLWGDHQDPYAYLTSIGVSKAQLAKDLKAGKAGSVAAAVSVVKGTAKKAVAKKPAVTKVKAVNVHYAFHTLNGGWLPEVKNYGSGSNGFAGTPNARHDLLYIKVDRGSVKYRVHTLGGGWLPWVTKADKSDLVNGVAGTKGKVIDGVQIIFLTPKDEPYQQAFYRSQTTQRAGYLATCCDDGKSIKGFGAWAGMYGEPMDRLQIKIGNVAPF